MELLIAILSSSLVATLAQSLIRFIERRKDSGDASKKALMLLLYCKIKEKAEQYISNQSISQDDYHDVQMLHEAYHSLGGDGFLDKLMREIEELTFTV